MIDYKNAVTLGKIMKKIIDLRLRYYVNDAGVVMTYWQGWWYAWDEVGKYDKRLMEGLV